MPHRALGVPKGASQAVWWRVGVREARLTVPQPIANFRQSRKPVWTQLSRWMAQRP